MSAREENRTARCSRSWEASALEDGRLGAEGRAAFERHAEACATCQAELAGLTALRRYVQGDVREEASPLERRRLRSEIVRLANRAALAPRSGRHAPLFGALAVAAAVLIFVLLRRPSTMGATPAAAATSTTSAKYEVLGQGDAHWRASQEGGTTRVALSDGAASFHVEHLGREQRFLVALPDGEVEVRGTRFVVSVDHGQTRRVQVTEGRVALRLRDVREREIYAGEAWERTTTSAPASATATPTAPTTATETASSPTTTATRQRPIAGADSSAWPSTARMIGADTTPISRPAPATSPTSTRFAEAMSLFRAARYGEAEAAFDAFESATPGDARAEDAAWLRAVSRSRGGDATGAAKLAQNYLDRYPRGFRRAEAESLVRGGKP